MNWEAWLLGLGIIVVGLTLLGTLVIVAISVVGRLVFGPAPEVADEQR